jgi:hypothetical protein
MTEKHPTENKASGEKACMINKGGSAARCTPLHNPYRTRLDGLE